MRKILSEILYRTNADEQTVTDILREEKKDPEREYSASTVQKIICKHEKMGTWMRVKIRNGERISYFDGAEGYRETVSLCVDSATKKMMESDASAGNFPSLSLYLERMYLLNKGLIMSMHCDKKPDPSEGVPV